MPSVRITLKIEEICERDSSLNYMYWLIQAGQKGFGSYTVVHLKQQKQINKIINFHLKITLP